MPIGTYNWMKKPTRTNYKERLSNILLFVVVVVVPTPHTPGCMTYRSDRCR